jgi:NADH dehydrogenase
VDAIDRDAGVVHLEDGDEVAYDYAAVCLGAETAFYDLPGLQEHAIPLKRPGDARTIRESFLETCRAGGTAVVGGAGLSGVQVAGELAALADREGSEASVVLLEQLDAVAPSFPENFQRAVRDELETRGVDVRTGTTVERATADEVETDAGPVPYGTLVWAGGIRGPDALGRDRPVVRSDLRLDERTFVVGDAGRIVDADGEAVPASASAALREARTVADNLQRLVEHDRGADPDEFTPRLQQYRFDVPGWIVSVGDGTVAQVGPTVLRGGAARAMKATVGAGHLSSIGAVRQAADLVEAELGPSGLDDHRETVESALDEVGVDPAEVGDGRDGLGGADDPGRGRNGTPDPTGPIEIDIAVDDEEDADAGESQSGAADAAVDEDEGENEREDDRPGRGE